MHIAGAEVEGVVNSRASATVVGKNLERKFSIWQNARKVKVRQGDGCFGRKLYGQYQLQDNGLFLKFSEVCYRNRGLAPDMQTRWEPSTALPGVNLDVR